MEKQPDDGKSFSVCRTGGVYGELTPSGQLKPEQVNEVGCYNYILRFRKT